MTDHVKMIKILLLVLCVFLGVAILVTSLQERELSEKLTPIDFLLAPHSMQVFITNFLYQKIKQAIEIKPEKIEPYLNEYIHRPDPSFDLFYLPRRENYCQANFLYVMLNSETREDYIFMDSPNTDKLKKNLNNNFDFLNTLVHRQKDYSKKEIEKLQNMEWSPKIKLFFTQTILTYNNYIGKTSICLFQMANRIPGSSLLHRTDLLIDRLKQINETEKSPNNFLKMNEFMPKTYRLYDQQECNTFFEILQSKKFKIAMRNRIVFLIKNAEHSRNDILDFIEIHKLMRIYKKGTLCGKIKNKNLIQEYLNNQLRYKNGRKFVLRVYISVFSTKPLFITFNRGVAILDRFNKYVSFEKAVIDKDQVFDYLKETQTLNDKEEDVIYEKIKTIVRGLNDLALNQYLKDHRFFQSFAFDFVLDSKKSPILINWTGSPRMIEKNSKLVSQILRIESFLLNRKIYLLKGLIQSFKQDINHILMKKHKDLKYLEDFIIEIDNNIDFNILIARYKDLVVNPVKILKKEDLEGLEVIYNELEEENAIHFKG